MKKILALVLCAVMLLGCAAGVRADYEPDTDYMALMMEAASRGDTKTGLWAQLCRDEKIDALGLEYPKLDYTELMLLSKIIWAEAGSVWLSMEWKMCVGEVVLNRMASPEFPNTMQEVLDQPGQYYGKNNPYFLSILPTPECVQAAKRLLEGERIMGDPSVVFQSNYILGSGIHTALFDPLLGYSYFCFSSHPELYA